MQPNQLYVNEFYLTVGGKVATERKKGGMDQETFARHLGLSRTTIINIEKGRQRLSLEQAWTAAKILGISISAFLPPSPDQELNEWNKKVENSETIGDEVLKRGVMQFITSTRFNK